MSATLYNISASYLILSEMY